MSMREQIEDMINSGAVFSELYVNDGCEQWGDSGVYTEEQVADTRAASEHPETLPALPTAEHWLRSHGYVWRVVDAGIDSDDILSGYHSEATLEALAEYWTNANGGGEGSFELEIDGDLAYAIHPTGERTLAAQRMA